MYLKYFDKQQKNHSLTCTTKSSIPAACENPNCNFVHLEPNLSELIQRFLRLYAIMFHSFNCCTHLNIIRYEQECSSVNEQQCSNVPSQVNRMFTLNSDSQLLKSFINILWVSHTPCPIVSKMINTGITMIIGRTTFGVSSQFFIVNSSKT